MIMEGLTLKVINNGEEKLVELYEVICRILSIKDPENIGQESVCEKFTKKSLTYKMNKILGPGMTASIRDRLAVQNPKANMSFWRDNLLLEVLRMSKDIVNVSSIFLNLFLNTKIVFFSIYIHRIYIYFYEI